MNNVDRSEAFVAAGKSLVTDVADHWSVSIPKRDVERPSNVERRSDDRLARDALVSNLRARADRAALRAKQYRAQGDLAEAEFQSGIHTGLFCAITALKVAEL